MSEYITVGGSRDLIKPRDPNSWASYSAQGNTAGYQLERNTKEEKGPLSERSIYRMVA